jgi:hypothetical protein
MIPHSNLSPELTRPVSNLHQTRNDNQTPTEHSSTPTSRNSSPHNQHIRVDCDAAEQGADFESEEEGEESPFQGEVLEEFAGDGLECAAERHFS